MFQLDFRGILLAEATQKPRRFLWSVRQFNPARANFASLQVPPSPTLLGMFASTTTYHPTLPLLTPHPLLPKRLSNMWILPS